MSRPVSIALVQPPCKLGNTEQNIKAATTLCREAAENGANLICLPELFSTGYNLHKLGHSTIDYGLQSYPQSLDNLSAVAREFQCHIVCPVVLPTAMPGVAYNGAVLIDDQGHVAGEYAKVHLWGLEKEHFRAGDQLRCFDTSLGRVAILICYDIGFPEAARLLCQQGAEILIVPAAWPVLDRDLWELNLRQRALENSLFVAGINAVQYHESDNFHLFGNSMVCNPRGTVISHMRGEFGFQTADIDLEDLARFRQTIPYLRDRKPHLYGHG
ncbi:nitrilase-related carbon-nitrogen hydrolase [Endozoicomonadaceae bacterium StTr2]